MTPWPLTAVCVGWIAGTAWHLEWETLYSPAAYAAWVACTVLAWWSCRWGAALSSRWRAPGVAVASARALVAAAVSACLAMGVAGWRAAIQSGERLDPELEGVELILEGVVARLPQLGPEGVRFWFDVDQARWPDAFGTRLTVPRLVMLGWQGSPGRDVSPGALPPVRAGDRWRLPVRLKAPHGQLNPHGGDTEAWWWSQGVMAVGQVSVLAPREVQASHLASAVAHPIERWRQACRDRLWQQGLEPRLAGIVSALLLGDQAAMDPLDWDVFRRAGIAHLMSISGLHITLLAAVMRRVIAGMWVRGSWRRRPVSLWWPASTAGWWGGLLTAGMYAVFSGWGLPAQRTVLMLGVSVLLRTWGVRWPWWASWLLACAVVLAWEPLAWLQAGFWLSFVAVGLLMAMDDRSSTSRLDVETASHAHTHGLVKHQAVGDMSKTEPTWSWRLGSMLTRPIVTLWREQWRITLGLSPLALLLFREVSLIGVLANLLAIPWVTLCVTPLALMGVVWPGAWHLAALGLAWLQRGLIEMLHWGVPAWSVAAYPVWVAVIGLVGVGCWCRPTPPWLRWWGLPLLVPALGWQAMPPPWGEVEVVVADVGQGQAVLLRTSGHTLLYDAGPRYSQDMDAGQRVVVPLLQAYDARLDRLVLSHRDADHTGGAQTVLAMQPQADVLGSLPSRSALAQRDNFQNCEAGYAWVWDGVHFEVLHPQALGPSRSTSNAWSCVLRVRTVRSSLLLTGDIEASEEASLVKRLGSGLNTDVMLVPHHGSRTSSTADWLDAVQPRWAWVQAGYRNRFGHPAPDVLARYRERGITVLETARCGAIQWSSQQPEQMLCEREKRRRYWRHIPH